MARRILVIFFNINNSQDKGKKSFIQFSLLYIIAVLLLFALVMLLDEAKIVFIILFGLPIIYSLFMIGLQTVYEDNVHEFIDFYYLICIVPYIILFVIALFQGLSLFEMIAVIIGIIAAYVPTWGMCKIVETICKR